MFLCQEIVKQGGTVTNQMGVWTIIGATSDTATGTYTTTITISKSIV